MKEITYFYLTGCPYCRMADEMIAELVKETRSLPILRLTKLKSGKMQSLLTAMTTIMFPVFGSEKKSSTKEYLQKKKYAMC